MTSEHQRQNRHLRALLVHLAAVSLLAVIPLVVTSNFTTISAILDQTLDGTVSPRHRSLIVNASVEVFYVSVFLCGCYLAFKIGDTILSLQSIQPYRYRRKTD